MEGIAYYIARHGLAELLSPDLLAAMRLRSYARGEHLIRAGEEVRDLKFFVEGKAKVYSVTENGSSLLARFYTGFDVLGDVELFAFATYALSVEALEDCACLLVSAEAIRKAASRNAPLLMYLCGRLGRKLRDFNVATAVNLHYPVENRLASYLLAVSGAEVAGGPAKAGGPARAGAGGAAAATMDDTGYGTDDLGELADILGASYRQLARVVRSFRAAGILDDRRGRIRVLDREGLKRHARDLYL
jgi:CRP-like cAMP-binding protein